MTKTRWFPLCDPPIEDRPLALAVDYPQYPVVKFGKLSKWGFRSFSSNDAIESSKHSLCQELNQSIFSQACSVKYNSLIVMAQGDHAHLWATQHNIRQSDLTYHCTTISTKLHQRRTCSHSILQNLDNDMLWYDVIAEDEAVGVQHHAGFVDVNPPPAGKNSCPFNERSST